MRNHTQEVVSFVLATETAVLVHRHQYEFAVLAGGLFFAYIGHTVLEQLRIIARPEQYKLDRSARENARLDKLKANAAKRKVLIDEAVTWEQNKLNVQAPQSVEAQVIAGGGSVVRMDKPFTIEEFKNPNAYGFQDTNSHAYLIRPETDKDYWKADGTGTL